MTDETIRKLERAVAQTGDVATEARLLQERVRIGEWDMRQVRLAAFLGYPAAVCVVEGRPPRAGDPIIDGNSRYGRVVKSCHLREQFASFEQVLWFRGLSRWGPEVVARAGIAWVRTLLSGKAWADKDTVKRYMEALDAWLAEPTVAAQELVQEHAADVVPVSLALSLASSWVRLAQNTVNADLGSQRRSLHHGLEDAVRFEDQHGVRPDLRAVTRELLPWVLSSARRDRLEDDRPGELPDGPSLRQRVIEAETTTLRLNSVSMLSRHIEQNLTLVRTNGDETGVRPEDVQLQKFTGFFTGGSAMRSFSLEDVAEVRLGG